MSLGALDFGLLVDASVVMVENFVRRLEHGRRRRDGSRGALFRAAAFEVGRPIVFGVCIIVAVYVPIFSLQGLEGRMFTPMAFTVCVAVLGSLLLALTYVPMLSSLLLTARRRRRRRGGSRPCAARIVRHLDWALAHRAIVVGGAVLVLAGALASVPLPRHRIHAAARRGVAAHRNAPTAEHVAAAGHGDREGCRTHAARSSRRSRASSRRWAVRSWRRRRWGSMPATSTSTSSRASSRRPTHIEALRREDGRRAQGDSRHRLQLLGADGDAAGRGDLRRAHRARRQGVRRRVSPCSSRRPPKSAT